jgi:hypothetical protein
MSLQAISINNCNPEPNLKACMLRCKNAYQFFPERVSALLLMCAQNLQQSATHLKDKFMRNFMGSRIDER